MIPSIIFTSAFSWIEKYIEKCLALKGEQPLLHNSNTVYVSDTWPISVIIVVCTGICSTLCLSLCCSHSFISGRHAYWMHSPFCVLVTIYDNTWIHVPPSQHTLEVSRFLLVSVLEFLEKQNLAATEVCL